MEYAWHTPDYHERLTFAFVREPVHRLASAYALHLETRPTPPWLEWLQTATPRSQWDMLSRQGELIVDFIGHYESLRDDLDRLYAKLGIGAEGVLPWDRRRRKRELPHIGKTAYGPVITQEAYEIATRRWPADFECFGYAGQPTDLCVG